jgi:hypothetical protein
VNHDFKHAGYDLGANILGHLHPFRLLYAALSNHNAPVGVLWQAMRQWIQRARHWRVRQPPDQTEENHGQAWPQEARS